MSLPTIYLDLDGTMIDFQGGVKALLQDKGFGQGHSLREIYDELMAIDPQFYANLPWERGAKTLWNFIKNHDVIVLTAVSPFYTDEITKQKKEWVAKNLGPHIPVITVSHDKGLYANLNDILIDDDKKYLSQWTRKEGIAIQFKGSDTINSLKKIGITRI